MTMKNYAYYNTATGLIENTILIEDEAVQTLTWPDGYAVVPNQDGLAGTWSACGIGWSYINGQFVEPPMPEVVTKQDQPANQGAQTL